jgi:hypothetical protein
VPERTPKRRKSLTCLDPSCGLETVNTSAGTVSKSLSIRSIAGHHMNRESLEWWITTTPLRPGAMLPTIGFGLRHGPASLYLRVFCSISVLPVCARKQYSTPRFGRPGSMSLQLRHSFSIIAKPNCDTTLHPKSWNISTTLNTSYVVHSLAHYPNLPHQLSVGQIWLVDQGSQHLTVIPYRLPASVGKLLSYTNYDCQHLLSI